MERTREAMVDPVCGEEVVAGDNEYISRYRGVTYYFCCLNCQLDFEEAPERYLGDDA